ncbi:MAG: hypothetical protein ACU4EQ_03920 [Candidatus Nitrosoglobus sp.]|jgi:hypothetical protein
MAGRITESSLIIPAVEVLFNSENGELTTSELIRRLEDVFAPDGGDLEILQNRNDTKFTQKVRNLKSHKTLEKTGLVEAIQNGFRITEAGRHFIESTHLSDS